MRLDLRPLGAQSGQQPGALPSKEEEPEASRGPERAVTARQLRLRPGLASRPSGPAAGAETRRTSVLQRVPSKVDRVQS